MPSVPSHSAAGCLRMSEENPGKFGDFGLLQMSYILRI